jgi:fido (protein-threonine AMPylation protein)
MSNVFDVLCEYDNKYDILYLIIGSVASEGTTLDADPDVVIRRSAEDDHVTGAIIMDYSKKNKVLLNSLLPLELQNHLPDISNLREKRPKYLYLSEELLIDKITHRYNEYIKNLSEEKRIELMHDAECMYIHNTTAIELNTITIAGVHFVLNEDKMKQFNDLDLPNAKIREIREIINYKKVIEYRGTSRDRKVDIQFIKDIHACLMKDLNDTPGKFRTHNNVYIVGVDKQLAPADLIESELEYIIGEYYSKVEAGEHPFEQAVLFHYRFESIHPFTDGNGRTGREILNYMMEAAGFPRFLFDCKRNFYLSSLTAGNNEDFQQLVAVFVSILDHDYRSF